MKTLLIFLATVSLLIYGFDNVEYWDQKRREDQCEQQFNNTILDEIISQYKLELNGFEEISYEELDSLLQEKQINGGKAIDLESLKRLFIGISVGKRRLFIKDTKGYLIYKTEIGNNKVKTLLKKYGTWLVENEDERLAKKTYYPCFHKKPPTNDRNENKQLPNADKFYYWLDRKEYSEFDNSIKSIRAKALYKDAKKILKEFDYERKKNVRNDVHPSRQVYIFATKDIVNSKRKILKIAWAIYDAETGFQIESGKSISEID